MGGEYIASMKSPAVAHLVDENNRWVLHWIPADHFLKNEAKKIQPLPTDFTVEQRLTFKTQKEAVEYLHSNGIEVHNDFTHWGTELYDAWLCAHWHFGLWEDHWRWIDWDNDNWLTHWGLCSAFKIQKLDEFWTEGATVGFDYYFNGSVNSIKSYREYYRKYFPNSSFNIDREDGNSINYKDWAKKNIEALHKQDAYKNNLIPADILEKFYNVF